MAYEQYGSRVRIEHEGTEYKLCLQRYGNSDRKQWTLVGGNMIYHTVKWWYYSEHSGKPLKWTRWHLVCGNNNTTLCGRKIPKGDDRLLVVDYSDHCDLSCEKCYSANKREQRELLVQEQRDLIDKNLYDVVHSSYAPFAYGAFTVNECKEALPKEISGRKIAASLKRLGFTRHPSSGLWRRNYGGGK